MDTHSLVSWKWFLILGMGISGCSLSGSAAESDTLETAKKDLQTLPSADVSAPNGEPGIDGKKFDFAITPSAGGSIPKPDSGAAEPPISQGWLLDALQKSPPSGDDRIGTKKEIANARNEERLQADHETAKTWSPFLQQWLLPQNRNLAAGGLEFGVSPRDKNAGDDFLKAQAKSKAALGVSEPLTGNAAYHDPLAQRPNPYLDENTPTNAWPSTRDFTAPSSAQTNFPANPVPRSFAPMTSDPYPLRGDGRPDSAKKNETSLPPPTAPVVNEQKYFPQLNRF